MRRAEWPRAGLYALLLTLTLVLAGLSAHHLTPDGTGSANRYQTPAGSASVSAAASSYDVLQDRPRGAAAAGQALTTATPDTWWAMCCPLAVARTTPGWSLTGAIDSAGAAVAASGPPSSRAPPAA